MTDYSEWQIDVERRLDALKELSESMADHQCAFDLKTLKRLAASEDAHQKHEGRITHVEGHIPTKPSIMEQEAALDELSKPTPGSREWAYAQSGKTPHTQVFHPDHNEGEPFFFNHSHMFPSANFDTGWSLWPELEVKYSSRPGAKGPIIRCEVVKKKTSEPHTAHENPSRTKGSGNVVSDFLSGHATPSRTTGGEICRYCKRDKQFVCMNTRDMESASPNDFICAIQWKAHGFGELSCPPPIAEPTAPSLPMDTSLSDETQGFVDLVEKANELGYVLVAKK